MLATADSGVDFSDLNSAAKALLSDVLQGLGVESRTWQITTLPGGGFKELPDDIVAVVERGLVSVFHENAVVCVLEPGDPILPDNACLPTGVGALRYGAEDGAIIRLFDRQAFQAALATDAELAGKWFDVVTMHTSLLLRLNGMHIRDAVLMGGKTETFQAGAIIIQQGDPSTDVFSMVEGLAEVLVNDVPVAKIRSGELFGTMAALLESHRKASVRALEPCTVVRVPKTRFFDLVRSRPAAVQGLLIDMARSIAELNDEVVALRRRLGVS